MKNILNHLYEHHTITREEAKNLLLKMANGEYNQLQIASFLTVFNMRSITVDELLGFRDAMLETCLRVDLSAYDAIDLCGTGGDGKNTFNISTITSFVLAGAGVKVAKHGNYGVSSSCGSSNVLEHLGIVFTTDESVLQRQIEEANICFLHAPLFHPAAKAVAPVRLRLGTKTFFNMLGPMVNPAFVKRQMIGVFSLELARLYAYLYQKQEDSQFSIIHSLAGYDEISLTSPFKMISNKGEFIISPKELGAKTLEANQIEGGNTIEEAAKIFTNVLKNEATKPQTEVILTNSAIAIETAFRNTNKETSFEDAKAMAKESLESGKALDSLKKLLELSPQFA
ncbi:anthranilate phosphoribosyltransferase [Bernardetia sp. ABR2-2B]|uniref:anthranilate phosphoribosyltransferase n=1 Tax=Bernardetia sp. ABR2-2B TaxID=3127472 RepID=UPI0030CF51E6